MQPNLPWILALATVAVCWHCSRCGARAARTPRPTPLPTEWTLTARPVFSTDERRVYRQLREALPHHIVLSKLPLVRFSQPTDPQQVRYWYELLGAIHVTFAICSANGRVLAAIDLDTDRGNSRRVMQIKQAVLGACRVRYLRCPVDHLPSIPELQLLVPQSAASARAPQAARVADAGRDSPSGTGAERRRERSTLWQDSGFFQDSFFGAETRCDTGPASEFGAIGNIVRGGVTVREVDALPGGTDPPDADRIGRPRAPTTDLGAARSMPACRRPPDAQTCSYADLTPSEVLDALDAVGFRGDGRMLQLNSYENRVFQVMLEGGDAVVAKFYRRARWSDAQIAEEHSFALELAEPRCQ